MKRLSDEAARAAAEKVARSRRRARRAGWHRVDALAALRAPDAVEERVHTMEATGEKGPFHEADRSIALDRDAQIHPCARGTGRPAGQPLVAWTT